MADRPYKPETCAYCGTNTWCEIRDNGKPQCRACKVERFFECYLYPPLGYRLMGWQRKTLRALYGTVDPDAGRRVYRRAYESEAKQNGKSFMLGGLPIYHLIGEEDPELDVPEAYGVASARDQAGIVYNAAARLVQANPDARSRLKILESTKRILARNGHGLYAVLSADGAVQDGKRPSLLLYDELHRFTKKAAETVRTVLNKGMLSRIRVVNGKETGQPLMIATTTSGDEHECPLWASEYDYAQHVRDGSIIDPQYYVSIHQADPKRIASDPNYWKTREARVAANPSHEDLGGFLSDAAIEKEMQEAIQRPEKYHDYIRLNLNVPATQTDTPVVDMSAWYACGGNLDLRKWDTYDVDKLIREWGLEGRPCYLGGDLAWTTDFSATAAVFPPEWNGEKWKLLFFAWLPEERVADIERITRAPLADWVRRGFVRTVPGKKMSFLAIEDHVRWAAKTFALQEFCFDPWGQLRRSAEVLEKEGIVCPEIEQKITNPHFSQATKDFIEKYTAGEFQHGNNPVANWHVSCLSLRSFNDNVVPRKPERDSSKKRIDLVAATINALTRAILVEDNTLRYSGGLRLVG